MRSDTFTPFMIYCSEHRQKIVEDNAGASDLKLGQILVEQWSKKRKGADETKISAKPKSKSPQRKKRDKNAPKLVRLFSCCLMYSLGLNLGFYGRRLEALTCSF